MLSPRLDGNSGLRNCLSPARAGSAWLLELCAWQWPRVVQDDLVPQQQACQIPSGLGLSSLGQRSASIPAPDPSTSGPHLCTGRCGLGPAAHSHQRPQRSTRKSMPGLLRENRVQRGAHTSCRCLGKGRSGQGTGPARSPASGHPPRSFPFYGERGSEVQALARASGRTGVGVLPRQSAVHPDILPGKGCFPSEVGATAQGPQVLCPQEPWSWVGGPVCPNFLRLIGWPPEFTRHPSSRVSE